MGETSVEPGARARPGEGGRTTRPAVLFLNPSAQLGGAERSLLDILASLRNARPGWSLGLVVTGEGPLVEKAEKLGVVVEVLRLPPVLAQLGDGGATVHGSFSTVWSLLKAGPMAVHYALRLRRLIRARNPRLIHSNGLKMHILGAWSRPKGTPLVWHIHDFVSRRPIMSRLLASQVGRCSAVLANSRSVAADVSKLFRERVGVHLVYNAVDLDAFTPEGSRMDLDRLSGLPPAEADAVRVGLVATLGWWKGHDTFLEAVALLPDGLPVRAYVIGGPLYETLQSQHSLDRLRERAAALGIADRVGFTGFVDDVPAAMRSLDIVVHASTEPEAFGLVIIEGMASGRAVIASEAGGAAELLAGGETALGHRPGDARDLSRCIETLARDPGLRARMGAAGRAAVERDFDRRRLATDLLPVYSSLVSFEDDGSRK